MSARTRCPRWLSPRWWWLTVTPTLLLGCSSAAGPTTPAGTVQVTTSVTPSPALPGQSVAVTVSAVPSGGLTVDYLSLHATGLVDGVDSIATSGTGSQSATWSFTLPFGSATGTVTFVGRAGAGTVSGTGQATLAVADTVPPVISAVTVSPSSEAQVGDSLLVSFTATDNAAIARSVIRWSGPANGVDSVEYPDVKTVSDTAGILVPAGAPLGQNVVITLWVEDHAGQATTRVLPGVPTVDTIPPSVVGGPDGTSAEYVAGDSLHITAIGSDSAGLAWLGFRVGPPANTQDSVPASGTYVSNTFVVTVQSNWIGTPAVTVFARDRGGNLATANGGQILVSDRTRVPIDTVHLDAAVRDVAYDAVRDRLYLSQPSLQRVAVLDLATMTYAAPIATPATPSGIDLTPGDDSLIVALEPTAYIGVVDLTQASPTVDTLRLGTVTSGPDALRVMANDQAIVSITFAGSGYGGQVWDYDFIADSAARRTDVGIYSSVTEATRLARSADGKKLLLLIDDSCCPEDTYVYDATTNMFSAGKGTSNTFFPAVAADSVGDRFLIGNSLYDGSLTLINAFTSSEATGAAGALSTDGSAVYLSTSSGFVKLATSDGSVVTDALLPFSPSGMWVLPGTSHLVVANGSTLGVATVQ